MQNTKGKNRSNVEYGNDIVRFRKINLLGSGGNGEVFSIELLRGKEILEKEWSNVDLSKLVVKFFVCDVKKNIAEQKKRYERFRREVKIQREYCKKFSGVIPILECYCPEEHLGRKYEAWYIMPEAKVFKVSNDIPLKQKLEQMLELANVICQLHNNGIMHRDIKPDNIFFYGNQICLGDFGLVWMADVESLTIYNERIGPIKILPPELENGEERQNCNYKYSDVYLFAKVLWMYIKRDGYGFRGEYMRGMSQVYLDKRKFDVSTFEPIHELLEKATRHKWQERLTIEECSDQIRKQINVCESSIHNSILNQYIYREELTYFQSVVEPNIKVYSDKTDIYNCLSKTIRYCRLEILSDSESYTICPEIIRRENRDLYLLTERISENYVRNYLMNIVRLEIGENQPVFYTNKFELTDENYVSISALSPDMPPIIKQIAIDNVYEVKMIVKNEYM